MVLTRTGLKPIDKIQVGDDVKTHKNNWKKVSKTFKFKENKSLISINGVKSTKTHEYYVLNKKYKDIVNDNNIHEYAEWLQAKDLTREYLLLKINNKMKRYINFLKVMFFIKIVIIMYAFMGILYFITMYFMLLMTNFYYLLDQISDAYLDKKYPSQHIITKNQKLIINWCRENKLDPPIFFHRGSNIYIGFKKEIDLIQIILVFGGE